MDTTAWSWPALDHARFDARQAPQQEDLASAGPRPAGGGRGSAPASISLPCRRAASTARPSASSFESNFRETELRDVARLVPGVNVGQPTLTDRLAAIRPKPPASWQVCVQDGCCWAQRLKKCSD